MSLKAILFDIDNTLVLFDEMDFFRQYMPRIAAEFSDFMDGETFHQRMMTAIHSLLKNRGGERNIDFFMSRFVPPELNHDEFNRRFNAFYQDGFHALKPLFHPAPGLGPLFNYLARLPIKTVLASNPMWPEYVQKLRAQWAGLDSSSFHHITHVENTHFCKPQPEYYQEICGMLNVDPEGCLMVGNDPINDMAAGKIGMKTYLTTDGLEFDKSNLAMSKRIREAHEEDLVRPDYTGKIGDVKDVIDAWI